MSTLGEFASLLQLGFGTGIGLSVFRAPLDIRLNYLNKNINNEFKIIDMARNDLARMKLRKLMALKLSLNRAQNTLDAKAVPYMALAIFGAYINLLVLIAASVYADFVLTSFGEFVLISISVFYFIIIGVRLEYIAHTNLHKLIKDLRTIKLATKVEELADT